MTTRSAQHGTIRLERRYKASPTRVFAAWAEPKARAKWDVPGRWVIAEQIFDFREGGREVKRFGPKGDPRLVADTLYLDIVPNERIVLTYEMHMDKTRISVSLGTTEFKPAGQGTRLVYTEQAVYLDGHDDAGAREHGTRALFDNLEAALKREAAN